MPTCWPWGLRQSHSWTVRRLSESPNTADVTGESLAQGLPEPKAALVTSQRSGVVTRAAILLTARACDWISRLQRDFVFLYCALDRF